MTDTAQRYFCPASGDVEHPTHGGFDLCCDRPDLHQPVPTQQQITNIHTEMQRLGVRMDGWWCEPNGTDDIPEPMFGMRVHSDALRDWEVDGMTFDWDPVNGWTMDTWCAPGMADVPAALMEVADPFDVPAVARHFKAVIDGDIDEFRHAA
jgi:hypothetical protein